MEYFKNYVLPNYVAIVVMFASYRCLLDFLPKFEQNSRYPSDSPVPASVLASLDQFEASIGRFCRFASKIYKSDFLTSVTDERFFMKAEE